MKRLLCDKANFGVLEGFLTTLFGRRIKIQKLLESECNYSLFILNILVRHFPHAFA